MWVPGVLSFWLDYFYTRFPDVYLDTVSIWVAAHGDVPQRRILGSNWTATLKNCTALVVFIHSFMHLQ